MTIIIPTRARGMKNWDSDPNKGYTKILNEIATQVNSLVVSGVTADDYFSSDVRTIAVNTTLTDIATIEQITASNPALTLTMPAANVAPTIFKGGRYAFHNAGPTNSFSLNKNGGDTLLLNLKPGETMMLECVDDSTAAGTWNTIRLGSVVLAAGTQEFFIPAAAMWPSSTAGCAPHAKTSMGSGKATVVTLDFDKDTQEYAEFCYGPGQAWDAGTVKAKFHFTHASGTDARTVWSLEALGVSGGGQLDGSFGTPQVVADGSSSGSAANKLWSTGYTPAVTIGGSSEKGDLLQFRASRVVGNAADLMAMDARLHGVTLAFTTDAPNDA